MDQPDLDVLGFIKVEDNIYILDQTLKYSIV